MNYYLIMPEGCMWYVIEAQTAEAAYRGVCYWYVSKRIAVRDMKTGETIIFNKEDK